MAITYTVNPSGTFVYATATGELFLADIEEYFQKLVKDDRIVDDYRHLFDVRPINSSEMNLAAFQKLRQVITQHPQRRRLRQLAIVVSTDASFENARLYERLAEAEQEQVIVFNTVQTAKIWLGVDDMPNEYS